MFLHQGVMQLGSALMEPPRVNYTLEHSQWDIQDLNGILMEEKLNANVHGECGRLYLSSYHKAEQTITDQYSQGQHYLWWARQGQVALW